MADKPEKDPNIIPNPPEVPVPLDLIHTRKGRLLYDKQGNRI